MKTKKYLQWILITACIFLGTISLRAQLLAFPDAEGWAASTQGGRGGKIIKVTNLNATGTGSFAAAVAVSGPRIIVFEVGGIIDLKSRRISIKNPYLTVAGQTAPSPGITFIDGSISISETHDILIQHIRVRTGASRHSKGWEPDGIALNSAYNVILDHCSVSWAVDENMSASGPRFDGATPDDWRANTSHTTTFSNNIIAEGLSEATHQKGEHSKGSLIHDNATEIAIVKNLYASNMQRNPYFKGGARGVVVNNYIYNPGKAAIHYNLVNDEWGENPHETGKMSVIGNVLQYGPNTSNISLLDVKNGPAEIYMEDNMAKDQSGKSVDLYDGSSSKLVNTKPVWNDNLHTIPAADVRDYIIENAGARPWDRDEIDTRIINEMLTGTGQIIDFETEVGGFPDHKTTHSPFNENEWDLRYMIKISPMVEILEPDEADQFLPDSAITVTVEASDYDGKVSYVELFVNGTSEGQDTSAPYQWQFIRNLTGNYDLVAVAEDDSSLKSASDTVHISVVDTIKYNLNVNINGQGDVELNPAGTIFPEGTVVTLTALPAEGHEFAAWSDDLYSGSNPVNLHMNSHKNISANFLESVQPALNAYYSFDGISTVILKDQTENSHLAFIANMSPITLINGKFGDGLQFDGIDDYVRVVIKSDLDFTVHGFSLCFWIKQSDKTITAPWLTYVNEDSIGYAVYHDASGKVQFKINDGKIISIVQADSDSFITGNWVFVAAVARRSPDELQLYADGALIASSKDSTGNISNNARYIYLATDISQNHFFNGAIDELRIYNYAISEAEIQNLFSNNTAVDKRDIPVQYTFAVSNYPNPFNPNTNIEYTIPQRSKVKLVIYNFIGQKVDTIVDELKPAGTYEVLFNGKNLSSGVYVYCLHAGEQTIIRKMLLLK